MALEFRKKETYMALIKNSVGARIFSNLYFYNTSENDFEGIPAHEVVDVLKDGQLSCPYFVSSILHLLGGAIDTPHATVEGTIRGMVARGWQEIETDGKKLYPGDVVVWALKEDDGAGHYKEGHRHIGFILDEKTALSTSYKEKCVKAHDPWFRKSENEGPGRNISRIFAHPDLSERWAEEALKNS
jgi:hypothetical protein